MVKFILVCSAERVGVIQVVLAKSVRHGKDEVTLLPQLYSAGNALLTFTSLPSKRHAYLELYI